MMNTKKRKRQKAKKQAIEAIDTSSIVNPSSNKRKASTGEGSGRPQKAKKQAIEAIDTGSIVNPRSNKRSASAGEGSGRPQKARKRTPSPHEDQGAENVSKSYYRTPTTKRMASHSGLVEKGTIVYA